MAQPLHMFCGSQIRDIRNPEHPFLPLNLLGGVDTSKYALIIKSVVVVDLPVGSDYNSFDGAAYNRSIDPSNPRAPRGLIPSDFSVIELENLTGNLSGCEFIYSDKHISMGDWARVVNYALNATNNTSTQGFYGLIIECIPFATTEINFGKQGSAQGRITVVEDMIGHFNANNPVTQAYTDALCDSISMPTPPHIILTSTDYLMKYAGSGTKATTIEIMPRAKGYAVSTAISHRGGHKMGELSVSPHFVRGDSTQVDIIDSHRSYLAERILYSNETDRPTQVNLDRGDGYTMANLSSAFGGYFAIVINTDSASNLFHNTYIHEVGHCITPFSYPNYNTYSTHLNQSLTSQNNNFGTLQDLLKRWRGFGAGNIVSFDGTHLSPLYMNHLFHSCPLIYVVGNELLPMPSSSLLAVPYSQVRTPGAIYWGANLLGATCDDVDFPLMGEVFLYEAFIAVVNDFAYDADPKGQDYFITDDNEVFLICKPDTFENHVNEVIKTKSFFLKNQTLWGGIKPRGRTFRYSASRNADVIDFLEVPTDRPSRKRYLEELFFEKKIKGYDHGFTPTQEEEYKLNYEDGEVRNFSGNRSVDFFKRENYSSFRNTKTESNDKTQHDIHSHVSNTVLDLMEFEVLEGVIEVVNGEPRRTFTGVAEYSYIISKAKEDTEAELVAAFTLDEADAKIASIFGGVRMAKQMAFKNAQGEEECKYVYVVVRLSSNLSFSTATITDDKGRSIAIS